MSSLTDLRTTLEEHAETVSDAEATIRLAAVRHRVAAVRRRRAAGAGALALVLLAGAATAVWPRGADEAGPAAPRLLGEQAPAWVKSLGLRYVTDGRGQTFSRSGTVHVAASDKPQLYSWTTSLRTRVDVTLPDRRTWSSHRSDFGDWVVVPPGQGGALRFTAVQGGDIGVASYRLGDTPPAGYSADGITFRQDVAGAELLRGLVAGRGVTGVTTTFRSSGGRVNVALACSGLPRGDSVHFSFDGREDSSTVGPCADHSSFWDAGAGTTYGSAPLPRAGTTVHMRVWVTSGARDSQQLAPASVPGLRLAFGVYGRAPAEWVGGQRVPEYVEALGHTWTQSTGMTSSRGTRARAVLSPSPNGRIVAVAWTAPRTTRVTVSYRATGTTGSGSSGPGSGQMGGLWAPRGSTAVAELVKGTGRIGIIAYTPDG